MAKRPNLRDMGDVMQQITGHLKDRPGFHLAACNQALHQLLGEGNHAGIRKVHLRDNTLVLYLKSDALRHELSMQKTHLLVAINESLDAVSYTHLTLPTTPYV